MKINFQNLNIEPQPNPKPITVERVTSYQIVDGSRIATGVVFIRNSNLDPAALARRW
jgi:hypothetical protein